MQKTNHISPMMMTKDVVVGMDGNHTINNSAAVGPNTLHHNIYSYPTTTTTTTNNYLLPNYNNNTTGNNNNSSSSTTSSPFNLTSPNCLSSPIITPNSSTNSNNLDNNNNNNNNNNSNRSSNNNSPLIEKENNKHNLPSTVNLNSLNNNSSLTDLEQQVNFYKERFDTFKKGFLIERTSRLKTINDLYKFTKKMEILQKQLFEKDSALFALTNENIKLKEEIYEMNSNHLGDNTLSSTSTNNNSNSNNSFNSNGRDRSPSEVNNNKKKLLPNFSFKRRNTELNNNSSLQSMDGSNSNSSNGNSGNSGNINGNQNNNKNSSSNNSSNLNNNLNNQNVNDAIKEMKHWRELYRKVSSDLKKKEKEISDLTSSEHITKQMLMETQSKFKQQENVLQKSNENIQQLKMEIFQKENENRENLKKIELVELQYNDLQKLNEQLQNKLKEDEEIINNLKLELEEKQMHIKKLTEKCFEMKTQLNFVRLQIRKYKCKRITKTMLTATKNDCVIVLHKNPQNGLLWIDIKVKNKKDNQPLDDENNLGNSVQSFPLTSIVDIVPDVHDVKRFTIYFYSKGNVNNNNNNNGFVQKPIVETFECVDENERTEVMQGIQEFISIAQSTLL